MKIQSFIVGLITFCIGIALTLSVVHLEKKESQWEVAREDFGHACIEYTKGGTRITEFVLVWEQEKGSETCHGELIDARNRWEIKRDTP
jgi:hypothetical protein